MAWHFSCAICIGFPENVLVVIILVLMNGVEGGKELPKIIGLLMEYNTTHTHTQREQVQRCFIPFFSLLDCVEEKLSFFFLYIFLSFFSFVFVCFELMVAIPL